MTKRKAPTSIYETSLHVDFFLDEDSSEKSKAQSEKTSSFIKRNATAPANNSPTKKQKLNDGGISDIRLTQKEYCEDYGNDTLSSQFNLRYQKDELKNFLDKFKNTLDMVMKSSQSKQFIIKAWQNLNIKSQIEQGLYNTGAVKIKDTLSKKPTEEQSFVHMPYRVKSCSSVLPYKNNIQDNISYYNYSMSNYGSDYSDHNNIDKFFAHPKGIEVAKMLRSNLDKESVDNSDMIINCMVKDEDNELKNFLDKFKDVINLAMSSALKREMLPDESKELIEEAWQRIQKSNDVENELQYNSVASYQYKNQEDASSAKVQNDSQPLKIQLSSRKSKQYIKNFKAYFDDFLLKDFLATPHYSSKTFEELEELSEPSIDDINILGESNN